MFDCSCDDRHSPIKRETVNVKERICSVVVTYNRCDLLKICLDKIESGDFLPDQILVINNASSDGTCDFLDEWASSKKKNVERKAVHLDKNCGGAGGFHAGFKIATQAGFEWIWAMDDDTFAEAGSLKALVGSPYFTETTGFLASVVRWKDSGLCRMNVPEIEPFLGLDPVVRSGSSRGYALRLRSSSFVSMLVNTSAIRKVGLPVSEFFIWFDDVEFSSRVSREFPCYLVLSSFVVHFTPSNDAVDFSTVSSKNIWKFKYGIRNRSSFYVWGPGGLQLGKLFYYWIICFLALQRGNVPLLLQTQLFISAISGALWNYRRSQQFI